MPAKKKYLSGPWQRLSKVLAAILGGYLATMLLHMAVATSVPNDTPVVLTTAYSAFSLWVGFMVLTFFMKKAWHAWGLFILISGFSLVLIYA